MKNRRNQARGSFEVGEEHLFLAGRLSTLIRIERIWGKNRVEQTQDPCPDEDDETGENDGDAGSLRAAVFRSIGDLLESRMKGGKGRRRQGSPLHRIPQERIDLDPPVASQLGGVLGDDDRHWCGFASAAIKHGPRLLFVYRESMVFAGTLSAVVDLRPWLHGVRKQPEKAELLGSDAVRRIFRDNTGPQWQFKSARVKDKFHGWWTGPGELTLDMDALAEGKTEAVASVDVVADQFVALCEELARSG